MAAAPTAAPTFAAALYDVTGVLIDLRPLSQANWFVPLTNPAGTPDHLDSSTAGISYGALGGDYLDVAVNSGAIAIFETAADELQPIVDGVRAGTCGALTASTLSDLGQSTLQFEVWLDQTSGDLLRWCSELESGASHFQGSAASLIGGRLATDAAQLQTLRAKLIVSGATMSSIINDALAELSALGSATAQAWTTACAAGLRDNIRIAVGQHIDDIVAWLTTHGIVAGSAGYTLDDGNPATHPGSTQTPSQYHAAADAKVQAALATYPKGDLRSATTWSAINAEITATVSGLLDDLDRTESTALQGLVAAYSSLANAFETWGDNPPGHVSASAGKATPSGMGSDTSPPPAAAAVVQPGSQPGQSKQPSGNAPLGDGAAGGVGGVGGSTSPAIAALEANTAADRPTAANDGAQAGPDDVGVGAPFDSSMPPAGFAGPIDGTAAGFPLGPGTVGGFGVPNAFGVTTPRGARRGRRQDESSSFADAYSPQLSSGDGATSIPPALSSTYALDGSPGGPPGVVGRPASPVPGPAAGLAPSFAASANSPGASAAPLAISAPSVPTRSAALSGPSMSPLFQAGCGQTKRPRRSSLNEEEGASWGTDSDAGNGIVGSSDARPVPEGRTASVPPFAPAGSAVGRRGELSSTP
ncbi:hypothetical protein SAMN05892883_4176 [Jatrophihabitans sp. GAS493]|uniref:hypothetical protein n=1 Tax=Jatrophihabitans sp. GAS493 TaxID=1907575 RepID=UPI000BB7D3F7|nr:hypothetical protein [Jatrophihabitans sp. GAS493]SOD74979.1 hypothetical protein SAMN05892883_4176 [Jatrophihabitans sp. GAS493]